MSPVELDITIIHDISSRLFSLLKTEVTNMNDRLDHTIKDFKEVIEDLSYKLDDVINIKTDKNGQG